MSDYRFERNAANRLVPTEVCGRKLAPYKGIGQHRPTGRKEAPPIPTSIDYPADGNKVVGDLGTALKLCGLRNGMTLSTHHHFRNGDMVANMLFDIAAEMGMRDLVWFPSASFPCHEPILRHLDSGVVNRVEGSLNGPLGEYASRGKMKGLGVLRSHGGRVRAIHDGDVHIDIAVIAAPSADKFGNANGVTGPSACGPLGYAVADSQYADKVIVVTDNLVRFPCVPIHIPGSLVDHVVRVPKIGEPEKIASGTTKLTLDPERLRIAEMTARFVKDAGLLHDDFLFQAGAGGISLAFAKYLGEIIKSEGLKVSAIGGGSTSHLVQMLDDGIAEYLMDGQAFDMKAVESLRDNPKHFAVNPDIFYNYHSKGMMASMFDVIVLGATEIDVNFNANVVTHSDGKLLHGIGGWQNSLFAKCTILSIPSYRNKFPILVDDVTTLVGPGELVDAVVTERGIAINPGRKDLMDATRGSGLPIRPIEEIKLEVENLLGGKPAKPRFTDEPVAVVEWVDGTILDTVWKLED